MTIRYQDTENETKAQIRPDWKAQMIKSWFEQNKLSRQNINEAKEMLKRQGWVLQTKRIGKTAGDKNLFKTEVLDAKGRVFLSFDVEEEAESL